MSDLTAAAEWLAATGYPLDFTFLDNQPPPGLFEALVDVVHADKDGGFHGNELTRDEVDSWLRYETGMGDQ